MQKTSSWTHQVISSEATLRNRMWIFMLMLTTLLFARGCTHANKNKPTYIMLATCAALLPHLHQVLRSP